MGYSIPITRSKAGTVSRLGLCMGQLRRGAYAENTELESQAIPR